MTENNNSSFVKYEGLPDGLSYSYANGLQICAQDKETKLSITPPSTKDSQSLINSRKIGDWLIRYPFTYLLFPVQWSENVSGVDYYTNTSCPNVYFVLDNKDYTAYISKSTDPNILTPLPLYKYSIILFGDKMYYLTTISKNALQGKKNILVEELPETVTNIGENAFQDAMAYLDTLPAALTSIGDRAFSKCLIQKSKSDNDFIFNVSELSYIGEEAFAEATIFNLRVIGDKKHTSEVYHKSWFSKSSALWTVKWDAAFDIPDNTFYNCDYLQSFTMSGNYYANIGNHAFDGCHSLGLGSGYVVTIYASTIGDYAFSNTRAISELHIYGDLGTVGKEIISTNNNVLSKITFHGTITTLGDGSNSIFGSIPKNVTFKLIFEKKITNTNSGVLELEDKKGLWFDVEFNGGVDCLKEGVFGEGGCVKSVTLKGRYDTLENGVLEKNDDKQLKHLQSVNVSWEYVRVIGSSAFGSVKSFNSDNENTLSLPGIYSLGDFCFKKTDLKTVKFTAPFALSYIGSYVFESCSSLELVDFGDLTTYGSDYMGIAQFSSCKSGCKVEMTQALYTDLNKKFDTRIRDVGGTKMWDNDAEITIKSSSESHQSIQSVEKETLRFHTLYNGVDKYHIQYLLDDSNGTAKLVTKNVPPNYDIPKEVLEETTDRLYTVVIE